ncbi:DnaB-like helicase N-terminal domain-containing protein [Corynebacterium flavescens]|uniref:DnaB-like helicase N-terminal domain-containing protein n=1 Tax=Corynebacterium flavescens TaxID=28028 RepID=UPI003FD4E09A
MTDSSNTITATISVANSEACLLAAMLSSRDKATIAKVADKLTGADFDNPLLERVFTVIQELTHDGRPTDAATVLNAIQAKGDKGGLPGDQQYIMADLVTLQIVDLHLADYARQVASSSYRRQFLRMTEALAYAAEHAAEDDLMELMAEHGRGQRKARERYDDLINL